MIPPGQDESPVFAIDSVFEFALTSLFPKNMCRCDSPGCPGNTIGSSNNMWLYSHDILNAPMPSPDAAGCSSVSLIRRSEKPGLPGGILVISIRGPPFLGLVGTVEVFVGVNNWHSVIEIGPYQPK